MIAQRRGDCNRPGCIARIRIGDVVVLEGAGWRHAKCPPARVVFVCQGCGIECPCDCGDNTLRGAA